MKDINQYPEGWDAERVKSVIDYYDKQTEDEEYDEIENALKDENITMFAVPNELADEVRALLARKCVA